jgi:DNA polymerase III epsilon subunit-like protein
MSLALQTTLNALNTVVRGKLMMPTALRIVFFDIETTGLNPYHDHIIEVAVRDNYGHSYQSLIKPPVPVPAKITEITGLTTADLADAPEPYPVALKFMEFLNTPENTMLMMVGHNSLGFDCRFIRNWLGRLGVNAEPFEAAEHVDTMRLAQYYYPGRFSYALVSLCKYAGIGGGNQAHRAMGDVMSTECLFNHIVGDIRRRKGAAYDIREICRPVLKN